MFYKPRFTSRLCRYRQLITKLSKKCIEVLPSKRTSLLVPTNWPQRGFSTDNKDIKGRNERKAKKKMTGEKGNLVSEKKN